MPSSSSSSSSLLPVALGPLDAPSSSSSSSSSSLLLRPSPPRGRRPRRVLYPASQSRRRRPLTEEEAPDRALRWLLLLSALVLLQIYTEETLTCTELQSQTQDSAPCLPQDGEGSLGSVQGWGGEAWRSVQMSGGAADAQLECVVA